MEEAVMRQEPISAREQRASAQMPQIPVGWVYLVFWISGFSALLYQMIWQRKLFTIYGTNIESITIVVTAFMIGLGLGSLAGGEFSKNQRRSILLWFSGIELGIGLYGFFSLSLFSWAGATTGSLTTLQTGLVAFALVLVPTLLMGATLPLLVAYFVRRTGSVGKSVAMLYFVNTLGAAAGSFAAALYVLGSFGMIGSVQLAAALNMLVAAIIFALWLTSGRAR